MSRFALCALSVLVLAACGGAENGPGTGDDGSAGNGNGGPGGTGSGGSGSPGAGSPNPGAGTGNGPSMGGAPPIIDPDPPFKLECEAPKVGSPVMRLLTRSELENSLRDIFPEVATTWSSSLPANSVSAQGFDNSAKATVGNQLASALLETAQSVATAVVGNVGALLPCAASNGDRACAGQFLDKYGKRLFRRALTSAEQTKYLDYFESVRAKSDFNTGLKWMTMGLIQSPHSVYRREIGTKQGDGRQLTPHEIATELAYTYTGTTPSADLLAKADSGNLGDVQAIARELIATDRGKQTLHRYFEAYLGYARVGSTQKPNAVRNNVRFGDVNVEMARETRTFIEDVLYTKKAGLKELLTAPYTNPSAKLVSYYGENFPAPSGDFASVTRPSGRGIGVLAQGSFLATHSNSDGSSPTQRGNFVYLRLLCGTKLEVPPDVPQLVEPLPGQSTTRQRYEEIHVKKGLPCAGCHTRFDPIGFGFEHFDEGGKYRADENGLPIDSSATAIGPDGTELFKFTTQEELVTGLANEPVVQQCFSAHLATYAFGTSEACLGSSGVEAAQAGTLGIVEAYVQLATEPHFTKRNAQ